MGSMAWDQWQQAHVDLKFEDLRRNEAHTNAEQPNNNC